MSARSGALGQSAETVGTNPDLLRVAKALKILARGQNLVVAKTPDAIFAPLYAHLFSDSAHEVPGSKVLLLVSPDDPAKEKNFVEKALAQRDAFLVVYFSEECRKKRLVPLIEEQGYRLHKECGAFGVYFQVDTRLKFLKSPYPAGAPEIKDALRGTKWLDRDLGKSCPARLVSIPAKNLLNANRFDIAIKAHYARLWQAHRAKDWREQVFYAQALRITGPSQVIREHDRTGKEGIEAFLETFHSLISQKDTNTYPLFPLDRDLVAYDGAHRIAAAIVNGADIQALQFDSQANMPSTAFYYAGTRHGHPPCPETVLDAGAQEYCRIKDSTAIALIFPSVGDHQRAVEDLSKIADIVYRKTIYMRPRAGGVLLRQVYLGESWLKWSDHRSGFNHKKDSCFPYPGNMTVLLLDRFDPAVLRPTKENIRAFYRCGKHSIHITDGAEETLRVARALFNANSRDFLDRNTGVYLEDFHEKFFRLQDWMFMNDIDPEDICVDGSAVLSALGLRACRDLDFLYGGDPARLPMLPPAIECHNDCAGLYDYSIADILGDPRLHGWYMGVKFCAPDLLCAMKKRRGESKDRDDVRLMRQARRLASGARCGVYVTATALRLKWAGRKMLGRAKRLVKRVLQIFGFMKGR